MMVFDCFRPKKGSPEDQQLYCDAHRKPGTPGSGSSMSKEPESTMDLFDLIARTQNSRIDDQRCELPGAIQVSQNFFFFYNLEGDALAPMFWCFAM